jgi:hypothetical protein
MRYAPSLALSDGLDNLNVYTSREHYISTKKSGLLRLRGVTILPENSAGSDDISGKHLPRDFGPHGIQSPSTNPDSRFKLGEAGLFLSFFYRRGLKHRAIIMARMACFALLFPKRGKQGSTRRRRPWHCPGSNTNELTFRRHQYSEYPSLVDLCPMHNTESSSTSPFKLQFTER